METCHRSISEALSIITTPLAHISGSLDHLHIMHLNNSMHTAAQQQPKGDGGQVSPPQKPTTAGKWWKRKRLTSGLPHPRLSHNHQLQRPLILLRIPRRRHLSKVIKRLLRLQKSPSVLFRSPRSHDDEGNDGNDDDEEEEGEEEGSGLTRGAGGAGRDLPTEASERTVGSRPFALSRLSKNCWVDCCAIADLGDGEQKVIGR